MSYRIYSTRGFVLGSTESGETSRSYLIYTEDFGLIRARAQGVRLLASKLRYNLGDYELLTLSLVRGKEFWRITGAAAERSEGIARPLFMARARVLSLVRRLVQGEERNDALFASLALLFAPDMIAEDVSAIETLSLGRALSALGYLDDPALDGDGGLAHVKAHQRDIIAAINKALKETQL